MYRQDQSKILRVKSSVEAAGGWRRIFQQYPGLDAAIRAADKSSARNPPQVPCPLTGKGKTKFRLFRDWGGYRWWLPQ